MPRSGPRPDENHTLPDTWSPSLVAKLRLPPIVFTGSSDRAAGQPRGEIPVDRLDDRIARVRAPSLRHQLLQVLAARYVAELDQHRWHVRGLEHAEAGRLERILVHARRGLELVHHMLGELLRKGLGLALGEIDQDAG